MAADRSEKGRTLRAPARITNAPAGVSGTVSVHLEPKTGLLVGAPQSIGNGFSTVFRDLAGNASRTRTYGSLSILGNEVFAQVDYVLLGRPGGTVCPRTARPDHGDLGGGSVIRSAQQAQSGHLRSKR